MAKADAPSVHSRLAAVDGMLQANVDGSVTFTCCRLAAARLHRAALVVSKVDRLTRSVSFLSRLLDAGVVVRFADLPQIEGATGQFMLVQMVAVAQLEAGMISKRTKDALAAAKRRGVQLGGDRGGRSTAKAPDLSVLVRRQARWRPSP